MSESIGHRVRGSIVAMQGRQAVLLGINLGVGIVLARLLEPAVFGLYGIAMFCLSLVTMVTDFGLAGSLIQRKDSLGHHEVSVAFTIQSLVSIGAALVIWFAAPYTLLVYKAAPSELLWVIRSLVPAVLLSPILTIAKIQLERELQFSRIAGIDVVMSVVNNSIVLAMALTGWSVWSFVVGNVVGTLAGTFIAWTLITHRPSLRLDMKLVREMFSFGMFFQLGNIANQAAGWVIPLISGATLGPAAVGLLTWASSNGRRPLMVVDNVMRVAFPHFSRLQDDPKELGHQLDLYFRRLLGICFYWATMGVLLAQPMTILVYTAKWEPGVLSLQLFAGALALDVANWVGGMCLTAIGGVKSTARWTLVKSVLAIGGSLLLCHWMGIVGVPIASAIASLVSGAGILVELRRRVPFSIKAPLLLSLPFVGISLVHLGIEQAMPFAAAYSGWIMGALLSGAFAFAAWRELRASRGGNGQ